MAIDWVPSLAFAGSHAFAQYTLQGRPNLQGWVLPACGDEPTRFKPFRGQRKADIECSWDGDAAVGDRVYEAGDLGMQTHRPVNRAIVSPHRSDHSISGRRWEAGNGHPAGRQ
jgi:hypothetical protein